jgi:hypothetical protein
MWNAKLSYLADTGQINVMQALCDASANPDGSFFHTTYRGTVYGLNETYGVGAELLKLGFAERRAEQLVITAAGREYWTAGAADYVDYWTALDKANRRNHAQRAKP